MNVWIRVARYSGTGALAAHTLQMRVTVPGVTRTGIFSGIIARRGQLLETLAALLVGAAIKLKLMGGPQ